MKIKHLLIIFLVIIHLCPDRLQAQVVHHLDLETAIAIAKKQSPTMQILQKQLEAAGHNLKATTSSYKTRVDLNLTLPQYDETIREYEDSAGLYFYPVR